MSPFKPVFSRSVLRIGALGVLLSFLLFIPLPPDRGASAAVPHAYGTRPLISYFALTASLETSLRLGPGLSPANFEVVRRVARDESAALLRLHDESDHFISDPALSLSQKQAAIRQMSYNRRVDAILSASDAALRRSLPHFAYTRLLAWLEPAWQEEVRSRGSEFGRQNRSIGARWQFILNFLTLGSQFWTRHNLETTLNPPDTPPSSPRSFKIYATRYDSKGRYTVALPDRCLKLTNGGLRTCSDQGYQAGQTYSVIISYKKSVGVDVGETGPWNVDDNFWAAASDPTPRRMFADLALGIPEAQAAFYNGYNGGLDQYGRRVTAPFAIDLAYKVADDLGIPAKMNDWVTVSMMWTDGWNASGVSSGSPGGGRVIAIETAAAKPDGSIIHIVQDGQALWSIAAAYGTTVDRLRQLNGLEDSSVIVPSQQLIVNPSGATATPRPLSPSDFAATASDPARTPDASREIPAQHTAKAERRTATAAAFDGAFARAPAESPSPPGTQSAEGEPFGPASSPIPHAAVSETALSAAALERGAAARFSIDPLLLAIGAAALLGLALLVWGSRLPLRGRKR